MYSIRHWFVYNACYQMIIITGNFYCKYANKHEFVHSTLLFNAHFCLNQFNFFFFRWFVVKQRNRADFAECQNIWAGIRVRILWIWNRWEKHWNGRILFFLVMANIYVHNWLREHIICNKERHTQIYSTKKKKKYYYSAK